jgi:hypothetical protein
MSRMRLTERASARRSSGFAQQDMGAAERTAGADHDRKAMTLWEGNGQTVLGAKPIASHVVDRSPRQQRRSRRAALTELRRLEQF